LVGHLERKGGKGKLTMLQLEGAGCGQSIRTKYLIPKRAQKKKDVQSQTKGAAGGKKRVHGERRVSKPAIGMGRIRLGGVRERRKVGFYL